MAARHDGNAQRSRRRLPVFPHLYLQAVGRGKIVYREGESLRLRFRQIEAIGFVIPLDNSAVTLFGRRVEEDTSPFVKSLEGETNVLLLILDMPRDVDRVADGQFDDVVLPNGFESEFVPQGTAFSNKRKAARKLIFNIASHLVGEEISNDALIISTSGRNDFRCKGFDVYLESLAQLNARLKDKQETGTKVLALIEVPCWTKGPRKDLLEALNEKKNTLKRLSTPMITHELYNADEDRILCLIKSLGLWNTTSDPVKILLIPCYLEGNDGIFNTPYYDLLTANDLCIYPSYYEPWGYTPLESCAFKTPCITTDLSGFGQWVNNLLGRPGELSDGVKVVHRTDMNYFETAQDICQTIELLLKAPAKERDNWRKKAAKLAAEALWKKFIKYYFEAYDFALRKVRFRRRRSAGRFFPRSVNAKPRTMSSFHLPLSGSVFSFQTTVHA